MIITHESGKLRVRTGYNPDVIELVKTAPDGRRWNSIEKTWDLPATIDNVKFCIDQLGASDTRLVALLHSLERPLERSAECTVDWRTTPFQHQVDGLRLILANASLALFWEQGCGKTLPAIKAIEHRMAVGLVKRTLIVSPKTVITAWAKEFARYSDIKPDVISGTPAKRLEIAKYASVALVNYDLLRMMDLAALGWDMVIFDESQYIKESHAQRSKAAHALARQAKYRLLLTGTPVGKDAGDIFGQFRVLDETIFGPSYFAFRAKYFVNVGHGFPDWRIRPEATAEIRAKVQLRAHRVKKADVLDLPEKLYQVRTVEMDKAQALAYRELERELLTVINDVTVTVPYIVTRMMRLNQVCSGFVNHEGRELSLVAPRQNPKLSELKQIVDDYDAGDGRSQVVVWCVFLHDIREICALYPDALVIDGSKTTEEREDAIDTFQAGLAQIMVCQQQAGAVGITLTAAHMSIFYSRNYSLLDRMQAEDRLHRIGQRNPVTYVDLIMANSVEQDIVDALEEKRLIAGYLQGDIESVVVERFRRKFKQGKE